MMLVLQPALYLSLLLTGSVLVGAQPGGPSDASMLNGGFSLDVPCGVLADANDPSLTAMLFPRYNMSLNKSFEEVITTGNCPMFLTNNCQTLSKKQVENMLRGEAPVAHIDEGMAVDGQTKEWIVRGSAGRVKELERIGCLPKIAHWENILPGQVGAFKYVDLESITHLDTFQPDTLVALMELKGQPLGFVPPGALTLKNLEQYLEAPSFNTATKKFWQAFDHNWLAIIAQNRKLHPKMMNLFTNILNTLQTEQDLLLWTLRTETFLFHLLMMFGNGPSKSMADEFLTLRKNKPLQYSDPQIAEMVNGHSPVNRILQEAEREGINVSGGDVSMPITIRYFSHVALDGLSGQAQRESWEKDFLDLYPQEITNRALILERLSGELTKHKQNLTAYLMRTPPDANIFEPPLEIFGLIATPTSVGVPFRQDALKFVADSFANRPGHRLKLMSMLSNREHLLPALFGMIDDINELSHYALFPRVARNEYPLFDLSMATGETSEVRILTETFKLAQRDPPELFVHHELMIKFDSGADAAGRRKNWISRVQSELIRPQRKLFRAKPDDKRLTIPDLLVDPSIGKFLAMVVCKSLQLGFTSTLTLPRILFLLFMHPEDGELVDKVFTEIYMPLLKEHFNTVYMNDQEAFEKNKPLIPMPRDIQLSTLDNLSNVFDKDEDEPMPEWSRVTEYTQEVERKAREAFKQFVAAFNHGLSYFLHANQLRYLKNPDLFAELCNASPLSVDEIFESTTFVGCENVKVAKLVGGEAPFTEVFKQMLQSLPSDDDNRLLNRLLEHWIGNAAVSRPTLTKGFFKVSCTSSHKEEIEEGKERVGSEFFFTTAHYEQMLKTVARLQGGTEREIVTVYEKKIMPAITLSCHNHLSIVPKHTSIMMRAIGLLLNQTREEFKTYENVQARAAR